MNNIFLSHQTNQQYFQPAYKPNQPKRTGRWGATRMAHLRKYSIRCIIRKRNINLVFQKSNPWSISVLSKSLHQSSKVIIDKKTNTIRSWRLKKIVPNTYTIRPNTVHYPATVPPHHKSKVVTNTYTIRPNTYTIRPRQVWNPKSRPVLRRPCRSQFCTDRDFTSETVSTQQTRRDGR